MDLRKSAREDGIHLYDMDGKVVLTADINDVLAEIAQIRARFSKFYYISGRDDVDAPIARMLLPDFCFVDYGDILSAGIDDTKDTLYVVKNMRITKIPDSRLGFLQRSLGYTLVIDNHPFSENGDTYHIYFNYSLFSKGILGYPHCYAFRDAQESDDHKPYDPVMLAEKVKPYTACYLDAVYGDDIEYCQIQLTEVQHKEYKSLKESLFESESSPYSIIRKLRKYTQQFIKDGLDLVNLSRIYKQYKYKGIRKVFYTDAKVDLYLLDKFRRHISDVNTFVSVLNG